LEKTRQLDEIKYTAVGVESIHKKKETEDGSSSSVLSHQNLTRWLDLAEMQDELKEKISEEQV